MKRYKVSIGDDEYRKDTESELPLVVRECIEKLIESGSDSGTVDIPGFCCHYSVCPDQYFPEDMIDTIHRIAAELRTMAETLSEIDAVQFCQMRAVFRSSASRLTAAVKKEHERNQVLNSDRIELLKDESSGLCPYHTMHDSGFHHYLNPDCPVCEREIDRRNNDCPNCRDY